MTNSPTLDIQGNITPAYANILTPEAIGFIAELVARFGARRDELLALRQKRQAAFDAGTLPDFLSETKHVRDGNWKVAPIPPDLMDRRVEITGPVDRKMIINALNSGASTFMADFEDSSSPTWEAMMDGQINIRDAVNGTITYDSPDGKHYALNPKPAVLLVRVRGWHLDEKHIRQNGKPVPAALVDFGLIFFHNARALIAKNSGPYFYLPKMESYLEARLWNDIFVFAQEKLAIPCGTIRATALIETIPAAFEMDEILYELRDHAGGLNCGRWDYIFSFIKCFRNNPDFVLPERGQVAMTVPFLRAYSQLLIKTCHKRGIHGIGGMAAQIPNKADPTANEKTMAKVRADKEREVQDGHDGTWVGHPGLVPLAKDIFDKYMPAPNQIDRKTESVSVTASDLVQIPSGTITAQGLHDNISIGLQYLEAWLRGQGCVPIRNLMEDAATAEISRAQIWQWVKYPKGICDDGKKVTLPMFRTILATELENQRRDLGDDKYRQSKFDEAGALLDRMVSADQLPAFLTSEAYALLP